MWIVGVVRSGCPAVGVDGWAAGGPKPASGMLASTWERAEGGAARASARAAARGSAGARGGRRGEGERESGGEGERESGGEGELRRIRDAGRHRDRALHLAPAG